MGKRIAFNICFGIGVALMLINIAGLSMSMRNPDVYHDDDVKFPNDITLTPEQFDEAVEAGGVNGNAFASRAEYIEYLTGVVNQGIAHYWYDQGIEKYHLHVPLFENFILYLAGYLAPEYFRKYEFIDYRLAVERGVGFCSQSAIVLTELLREKGIASKIVGLRGHVLATAPVDENGSEWWIFDPDYGVTIPYSLDVIEQHPDMIEPYYAGKGHTKREIDGLKLIYEPEGNSIKSGIGIEGYGIKRYYFEEMAYILKWLLPLALMIPALAMAGLTVWRVRKPVAAELR